jgi:hypothetical protein
MTAQHEFNKNSYSQGSIPKGQNESGLIFPLNGGIYDCKFFAQFSDEFELKFPELSRAELGHFNIGAEIELSFFYIEFKTFFCWFYHFLEQKISYFKKKKYYSLQRKLKIEGTMYQFF